MSEGRKPSDDAKLVSAESRELLIYKDYLRSNMTMEEIAAKYEISVPQLYNIARIRGWKEKRKKARERAYLGLDEKYKDQIISLVSFIDKDVRLLIQKCEREKREMTKEERQYVLKLFDTYTKEQKLADGKPTEISGGTNVVEHRILLPPGVTRFGVIPPDPNVIQVEAQVVEEKKEEPEDADDEDFEL